MVEDEIKRTDAKIRLGMLEEAKRELLVKVNEHEKSLKILLSQVKTMQRLIEEAQSDMQSLEKENVLKLQEEIDKQTEVLEEMLEDTKKSKKENFNIIDDNPMYQGTNEPSYRINENLLTTAASANSTNTLQRLKYKTNWTDKDAKDFFNIYQSVKVSQDYQLNSFVQENINQTNSVLQDVLKKQENQIQQHYKPANLENNFRNRSNNSYQQNTKYKSSNDFKITAQKKISGLEKTVDKK